jgi:acyl-CoA synthetase (AMP-forming)/AMP-acid ligase II
MIIRGGENIYGSEIEQVLFGHPGIQDAAVLGLPDPTWGEVVVAVLVPDNPAKFPTASELRDFCREHLSPQKTPIRWFRSDTLPLTGSGKIQKFRLLEQISAGELAELPPCDNRR